MSARRSSSRGRGGDTLALVLAAAACLAVGFWIGTAWQGRTASRPAVSKARAAAPRAAPQRNAPARSARTLSARAAAAEPVAATRPPWRIALVIDDLGRSLAEVDAVARLGVPLTIAVLPHESMTPQVVTAIAARRLELICHLPMEASHPANPGEGALRGDQPPEELARRTRAALDAVPGAVGANNHMGSMLTAEERPLAVVLGVLAERGLFFLDSRTTPDTVGFRLARELGLPAAERQVFLDPEEGGTAPVEVQWQRLLDLARAHGAAIAIGHPHPPTMAVLAAEIPRARAAGFEFVPVSYLVVRGESVEEP